MKNKASLFLFLISILFQNQGFAQDYWEVVNTPPEIYIYSMGVNSNGIIYIGLSYTTGGGVLRSNDGGNNWVTSGLQNMGIISLKITLQLLFIKAFIQP